MNRAELDSALDELVLAAREPESDAATVRLRTAREDIYELFVWLLEEISCMTHEYEPWSTKYIEARLAEFQSQ